MHIRTHPIYGAPLALALHLSTVQHEHSNKRLYQHAKQILQSIAYLYTRQVRQSILEKYRMHIHINAKSGTINVLPIPVPCQIGNGMEPRSPEWQAVTRDPYPKPTPRLSEPKTYSNPLIFKIRPDGSLVFAKRPHCSMLGPTHTTTYKCLPYTYSISESTFFENMRGSVTLLCCESPKAACLNYPAKKFLRFAP